MVLYRIACDIFYVFGMWLSLVERHIRDVEAAGSSPVIPIIILFEVYYEDLQHINQNKRRV